MKYLNSRRRMGTWTKAWRRYKCQPSLYHRLLREKQNNPGSQSQRGCMQPILVRFKRLNCQSTSHIQFKIKSNKSSKENRMLTTHQGTETRERERKREVNEESRKVRVYAAGRGPYSRLVVSTIWQTVRPIMDVLPVPDWAWAMTSRPRMMGITALCWMADGFSKPYW